MTKESREKAQVSKNLPESKCILRTRFYVDPATGEPHIHNDPVHEDELIDVLDKPGEMAPGLPLARQQRENTGPFVITA